MVLFLWFYISIITKRGGDNMFYYVNINTKRYIKVIVVSYQMQLIEGL